MKYNDAVKRYCNKQKCKECDGSDESGEPNGYGCDGLEEYLSKLKITDA